MQFLTHLIVYDILMIIVFTPYSFMYMSFYIIFLFSLLTISNFYYYWVFIEIISLLFIGLGYSILFTSTSHLILYFLIQSISSFSILVFYIYSFNFMLTLSFLLKLSIFPFCFWYIRVVYSFPNILFLLASTLHKLPLIFLLMSFNIFLDIYLFWFSVFLRVLFRGMLILSSIDVRFLLVVSSIGNNSWFLLSQIAGSFVFFLYFLFYSISLFFVVWSMKSLSNLNLSHLFGSSNSYFVRIWVLSLSGMPPFPIFFLKILILYSLFIYVSWNVYFFVFILFCSFIFIGYLYSLIKYYVYNFSCSSNLLFYYWIII